MQISGGKKNQLWMSLEFLFFLLFETVLCDLSLLLRYFSTPQGVICKLSFLNFISTKRFTDKMQKIFFITLFVFYVRGLQLFKDLIFQHFSHVWIGYKNYTITKQGEHFDCYRLHLFMRHIPLCTVFFLPPSPVWLTLSECFLKYSHYPNICSII